MNHGSGSSECYCCDVEEDTRVGAFGTGFQPDELKLMGSVLDEAAIILPEAERTSAMKAKLATRILSAAAKGERDPNKLRNAALLEEVDV
jgi:hypothetical protein